MRDGIPHGCANTEQQRTALLVETEAKVPIISTPQGFNEEELYVDLEPTFGHSVFLKCEGFNFAGSIKLKAATEMVEAAERDGILTARIGPGRVLVRESGRCVEHDRGEQGLRVLVRH